MKKKEKGPPLAFINTTENQLTLESEEVKPNIKILINTLNADDR